MIVPGFGGGSDFSSGIVIGTMTPWGERRPGMEIVNEVNQRLGQLTGVRAFASMRSSLGGGGGGGDDIEIVLQGPDYETIDREADRLIATMEETNANLLRARKDFEPTSPRLVVDINRERAAGLGVSVSDIGRTLQTHLGSRRMGQFIDRGEAYNVIAENRREDRASQSDLEMLYVRGGSGELIPLSNLVTLRETGEAQERNRLNRQRSITISATLAEGYTLGEAIEWLESYAQSELPAEMSSEFVGSAREFLESSNAMLFRLRHGSADRVPGAGGAV